MVSSYDDQATHHAALLTYYALMSLFPTLLLAMGLELTRDRLLGGIIGGGA